MSIFNRAYRNKIDDHLDNNTNTYKDILEKISSFYNLIVRIKIKRSIIINIDSLKIYILLTFLNKAN